jgi:hypothetical protein
LHSDLYQRLRSTLASKIRVIAKLLNQNFDSLLDRFLRPSGQGNVRTRYDKNH